jgi:hypothetical protein
VRLATGENDPVFLLDFMNFLESADAQCQQRDG